MNASIGGFLLNSAYGAAVNALIFASLLCLLLAAELAFPKGEMPTRAARWRHIQFALILIPFMVLFQRIGGLIVNSIGWTPSIHLGPSVMPIAIGGLLYIFIYDFIYYWLHRAQHAVPWLWRFHSVHHSAEHLAAGSGFHPLAEAPMRAAFVGIPMGLLVDGPSAIVWTYLYALHGYYQHTSTRLNFGTLARIVTDNRIHRIHHSREARHFDKNFGQSTFLWDQLFGTAYWPGKEWPEVGLDDQPEPRTIRDWLMHPFDKRPLVEARSAKA